MGFGSRWPGVAAVRLHAAARLGDGGERAGERAQAVGQLQQTAGEDGLERADGVGAVGPVGGFVVPRGRRRGGQDGMQIVGEDLGGEVLLEGQMSQSGGGFQPQPMLDPFEQLGDILPGNVSHVKS